LATRSGFCRRPAAYLPGLTMFQTVEQWRGTCLGVELLCLPLPGVVSPFDLAVLSAAERNRAAAFGAERRRSEFVASRAHLRRALALVLGQRPESIEIQADEHGKPRLAVDSVRFNLSHTANAVLIGWGPYPLGVDLELAGRRTTYIQRLPLLAEISAASGVGVVAAFTLVEAALKALGPGLGSFKALRLDHIDEVGGCVFSSGQRGPIHAATVPVPVGYVGSVAVVV